VNVWYILINCCISILQYLVDIAQIEASLTHHSHHRKEAFFDDLANHANKILVHEVCFKTSNTEVQEQIKKDMSRVLNIGFYPETKESYQEMLKNAGYTTIDFVSVCDLALLSPKSVIKDEGLFGFVKILYNAITKPYLRSRMLATRKAMSESKELAYIIIVASKE